MVRTKKVMSRLSVTIIRLQMHGFAESNSEVVNVGGMFGAKKNFKSNQRDFYQCHACRSLSQPKRRIETRASPFLFRSLT